MRKGMCVVIALSLIMPVLLVTASCGKKKVPVDTMAGQQDAEAARYADMDKQRLDEEARMREEALKDEAMRQEQIIREQFESEDIYFEFDSAVLTSDSQALLKKKAEWMKNNTGTRAVIEGHCDERGTNEYNLALGDRRAESAKTFLVTLGVSPSRMTTISYGEEKPMDTGKSESAYAKNRRAHFRLK